MIRTRSSKTPARGFGLFFHSAVLGAALATQTVLAGNGGFQIVFTDSQAALLAVDPTSGGSVMVAQGQKLVQPLGIAMGSNNELFIADPGCGAVLGYNVRNSKQRVVASGGILGVPFGVAVEPTGNLLVANAQALVRINPSTGAKSIVSSGQFFLAPLAVAVAADGGVYVADEIGRAHV